MQVHYESKRQVCHCSVCSELCDRVEHETHECPERIVECSFGCGIQDLKFKDLKKHELTHTKEATLDERKKEIFQKSLEHVPPEPCPKCGMLVDGGARNLQWHLKRDCPERIKVFIRFPVSPVLVVL